MELNFPGSTIGLLFSIVEIITGAIAFLAEPLVALTIELANLWPYYYTMIGCSVGLLTCLALLVAVGTNFGPSWVAKLDDHRRQAVGSKSNEQKEDLLASSYN